MATNGISTLALKRDRQDAKLAQALADRIRVNATDPGRYTTDPADPTQLPTRYNATSNSGELENNPNVGGLLPGRPWA